MVRGPERLALEEPSPVCATLKQSVGKGGYQIEVDVYTGTMLGGQGVASRAHICVVPRRVPGPSQARGHLMNDPNALAKMYTF